MTRPVSASAQVPPIREGSFGLLQRWIEGDEEALVRWLEGSWDRFGAVRLLEEKDRTIAAQVEELRRRLLQIETLRDALLAARRAPPGNGNNPRARRRAFHRRRSPSRRGGARSNYPTPGR